MQLKFNSDSENKDNNGASSSKRPRAFASNVEKQEAAVNEEKQNAVEQEEIERENNVEEVEAEVIDEGGNKKDLGDLSDKEEKKSLKFNPGGLGSEFFKKKTKESSDKVENAEVIDDEEQEIKNDNTKQYEKEGEALSWEDLVDISEFGIELLDTGVSTLSNAIAKDSDAQKYEVTSYKKQKLSRQLAKILEKYSFKMKLEFLFVISLILVFSEPVRKAMKARKKKRLDEEARIAKRMAEEATTKSKEVVKQTIEKPKHEDSTQEPEPVIQDVEVIEDTADTGNARSRTPSFGGPREFYEQN